MLLPDRLFQSARSDRTPNLPETGGYPPGKGKTTFQKKPNHNDWFGFKVPETGLEPVHPFGRHPLKMVCLPIPPLRQFHSACEENLSCEKSPLPVGYMIIQLSLVRQGFYGNISLIPQTSLIFIDLKRLILLNYNV